MRWLVLVLALTGCTSAITMRNPVSGDTAKCGPYYYYGIFAATATQREMNCVADYRAQGFMRVPE